MPHFAQFWQRWLTLGRCVVRIVGGELESVGSNALMALWMKHQVATGAESWNVPNINYYPQGATAVAVVALLGTAVWTDWTGKRHHVNLVIAAVMVVSAVLILCQDQISKAGAPRLHTCVPERLSSSGRSPPACLAAATLICSTHLSALHLLQASSSRSTSRASRTLAKVRALPSLQARLAGCASRADHRSVRPQRPTSPGPTTSARATSKSAQLSSVRH